LVTIETSICEEIEVSNGGNEQLTLGFGHFECLKSVFVTWWANLFASPMPPFVHPQGPHPGKCNDQRAKDQCNSVVPGPTVTNNQTRVFYFKFMSLSASTVKNTLDAKYQQKLAARKRGAGCVVA
jgi:hypothetical protein